MKRLLGIIAAAALVTTACGGGGSSEDAVASLTDIEATAPVAAGEGAEVDGAGPGESDDADDALVDTEEALLAFTECMREEGVDIADPEMDADGNLRLSRPSGSGTGGDFDREAARAAREACQEHLDGVTLGRGEQDRTAIEDTLLEYAACMRDQGVDFPDPDFSASGPGQGGGGPGGGGPFGQIDRNDPGFQAADETCREIFTDSGVPQRGGGPGPGGGS